MTQEALQDKAALRDIFVRLSNHELTYDQAAVEAEPLIDSINKRNKEAATRLAKKYNVRPRYTLYNFVTLRRIEWAL